MTLANTGTGDATGVVAHDALPAGASFVSADTNGFGTFDATTGAWNIGTIAVGATATLTVTATVASRGRRFDARERLPGRRAPRSSAARRGQPLPSPDEESSCATTTVPGIPQLTQSKAVDAGTAVSARR